MDTSTYRLLSIELSVLVIIAIIILLIHVTVVGKKYLFGHFFLLFYAIYNSIYFVLVRFFPYWEFGNSETLLFAYKLHVQVVFFIVFAMALLLWLGRRNESRLEHGKANHMVQIYDLRIIGIISTLVVGWFFVRFILAGGIAAMSISSRLERGVAWGEASFWLEKYVIIGTGMAGIIAICHEWVVLGRKRLSNLIGLTPIIVFLVFMLIMGNRREFMYLMMTFLFVLFDITLLKTWVMRFALPVVGLMPPLVWLGFSRLGLVGSSSDVIMAITLGGEFVFPYQTLLYWIDRGTPLLSGSTYLIAITNWIPRSVWPEKTWQLGEQFARAMNFNATGGMGWAYHPLAESYMNWGEVAPLFLVIEMFIICKLMEYCREKNNNIHIIMMATLFSFQRADFASWLTELLLFVAVVSIVGLIARSKLIANSSKEGTE